MDVRLLGSHKLESHNTRHTCLLVDKRLALDAGSLASALSTAEQAQLRAVLLTHSHIDHVRDLPTLGLATLHDASPVKVYALPETLDAVHTHLLNGCIYPDLTKRLSDAPAKYRFCPVQPGVALRALGYQVKPLPMLHTVPCVGFIVKSDDGGCLGYTGDTGGGLLPFFRDPLGVQVLFVDVSFPNRLNELAGLTGHLTPVMLQQELLAALEWQPKMPRVVAVHLSGEHEDELGHELASVADAVGIEVCRGYEGMVVRV